jgi:hypothetical protein
MAKPKPKTAQDFIGMLQDPDAVGQSEYRAVHGLLSDMVSSDSETTPAQLDRRGLSPV